MSFVSECEKRYFQDNGVVCLRSHLSATFVELLQTGFQRNLASPSEHACSYTAANAPGMFRDDYCNWGRINEFRKVIFESPFAQTAATLLNAREIRIFHDHIFFKAAGTIKKTPWHQDLPYYCVDGDQGVSFWIPLTDIDESNQMEFIAGSHRWNKLVRPTKFNGIDQYDVPEGLYQDLPNIDDETAGFTKLKWTMTVGDVVAFDFRTVHGNTVSPLPTLHERRVVSLRFLGENMRYTSRPGEKSPPFPELRLKPGDAMDHPLFPVVWKVPTLIEK